MLGLTQIREAQQRISDTVHITPLDLSNTLSKEMGYPVYLKLENLQKTGSFKIRGALNKLAKLNGVDKVVAASAGNHAQGVAYAASKLGLASLIIMPEGAPITKVEATKGYGAEVIFHGEAVDDGLLLARKFQTEKGYTFVHAFDDPDVIAGQGTIGLEIIEQLPNVDRVITPVGGGGLISGMAIALKQQKPNINIIGVQAAQAASMVQSVSLNRITTVNKKDTIADGIGIKTPGKLNFELVTKYVDDLLTVTDEEIASAILFSLERNKLILEGAGAAALAALLHHRVSGESGNTVVVLSGGNIDVNRIARIIDRGLVTHHRRIGLRIVVSDLPGSLTEITKIIGELRGNILEIHHNRVAANLLFGSTELIIALEIIDLGHGHEIIQALRDRDYRVMEL